MKSRHLLRLAEWRILEEQLQLLLGHDPIR